MTPGDVPCPTCLVASGQPCDSLEPIYQQHGHPERQGLANLIRHGDTRGVTEVLRRLEARVPARRLPPPPPGFEWVVDD